MRVFFSPRLRLILFSMVCGLIASIQSSIWASTYDLSTDFSTNSNPNGVWSYGWEGSVGGSFNVYTTQKFGPDDNGLPEAVWASFYGSSAIFYNPTHSVEVDNGGASQFPPGTVWWTVGAPGQADNFGAIRFTVPAGQSGVYSLAVNLSPAISGPAQGPTAFYLVKNGTQISADTIAPGESLAVKNSVALQGGDSLDLLLGRGVAGTSSGDVLIVQATLTTSSTNTPPPTNGVYDLSSQFGNQMNPSGAWTYGWKTTIGGSLIALSNYVVNPALNGVPIQAWYYNASGPPAVFHNGSSSTATGDAGAANYPPGTIWMAPGYDNTPQNYAAIRFTVPAGGAGVYALSTAVHSYLDGPISGDTDFHVVWNGTEVFGQFLPGNGGTNYGGTIALTAGDTIDFLCGRGADGHLYRSGLKISANFAPTNGVPTITTNNPPPGIGSVYDISVGFETNSNPSGVWSYGWKSALGGSFSNYTTMAHPVSDNQVTIDAWTSIGGSSTVFYNPSANTATSDGGQSQLPPGTVWFDPGADGMTDNFGAIRFTVPAGGAGYYTLSSFVAPAIVGSLSGDCDFHVVTNGVEAFGEFLSPTQSTGYTNEFLLASGDTIDFMIGRGADGKQSGSVLKIAATIVAGGAAVTNTPPPPSGVFDVSKGFGTSTNPSGFWSYGWENTLGGSFSNYSTLLHPAADNGVVVDAWTSFFGSSTVYYNPSSTTAVADGGQSQLPPGTVWFYPGAANEPDNYSVIRFTVPPGAATNYTVSSFVSPAIVGSLAGDTDYHVLVNGTEVFGQFLAVTQSVGYSNTFALNAGATVDFVIGRGADGNQYGSVLKIAATIVPGGTLGTNPPPPPSGAFDVSKGFGTSTNPSGVWSYGWKNTLGGSFSNYPTLLHPGADNGVVVDAWTSFFGSSTVYYNPSSTTAVADGGQSQLPPGTVWFYPGAANEPDNYSVIRFTVPPGAATNYTLSSFVSPAIVGSLAGDTDFHVVVNGSEVFGQFLAVTQSVGYSNTFALNAGATVDLVIGRGADGNQSGSVLKIAATIVPGGMPGTNSPPPPSGVFDVSKGFGTSANPSGVWSYGWKNTLGGSFSNYPTLLHPAADNGVVVDAWTSFFGSSTVYYNPSSSTAVADGGESQLPPGTVWFYPGAANEPDNYSVIRFTVPAGAGTNYTLSSFVSPAIVGSLAGDTDFHVVVNGAEVFGQFLAVTQSVGYSNTFALNAGATVDFVIGRGADGNQYGSVLKIAATIVPGGTLGTNPPPPPSGAFDVSKGFGTNANPSGVWSYGWENTLGGSFSTYPTLLHPGADNGVVVDAWTSFFGSSTVYYNPSSSTAVADGGQSQLPPGTVWFYPGAANEPDNYSVIRFTVPHGAGTNYTLASFVSPAIVGSLAGDTDFHVVVNGAEMFGQFLAVTQSVGYSNTFALSAGATVDFVIGRGADGNQSGSVLKIVATIVPGGTPGTNSPPPPSGAFDVSKGFGTNTNPSGVWSYGWKNTLGGSFSNYPTLLHPGADNGVAVDAWTSFFGSSTVYYNPSSTTAVADGGQSQLPPGTVWFYPGAANEPDNYSVIRFTVPPGSGTNYTLASFVSPAIVGSLAGDTDFHVVVNGAEVFGQFLAVTQSVGYSNTFALNAGATVDLVIGRGADGNQSGSVLKIAATIVPGGTPGTNGLPPVSPVVYDLSKDFSSSANPSGVWTYGWKSSIGGSLSPLTNFVLNQGQNSVPIETWHLPGPPGVFHNGTTNTAISDNGAGNYPPGTSWFYAGNDNTPQNYAAFRFTVPSGGGGLYALATAVHSYLDGAISGDSDFHVVWNGTEIFGQFLPGNGGASYGGTIALAAGDTIDLLCGRGADGHLYGSGLKISATFAPTNGVPTITTNNPPPPATNSVYDLSAQFGNGLNPSGVWTYGWKSSIGGSLFPLANFVLNLGQNGVPIETWHLPGPPGVFHNGTTNTAISDNGAGNYPPGTSWFYAGSDNTPQNYGAIRFTVPVGGGGVYTLSTAVRSYLDGAISGDTDFHVVWNGTEVFGQFLPGNGGTIYGGAVALAAGDTIDFLCGRGADGHLYGSGLKISAILALSNANPTITTNPPPSTNSISSQFGTNSNPNGAWSYGWKSTLNGSFSNYMALAHPVSDNGVAVDDWSSFPSSSALFFNPSTHTAIIDGGQGQLPPGSVWCQAGVPGNPDYFAGIRFTVPMGGAGNYDIGALAMPGIVGPNAGAYEFHVVMGGTELFGQFLSSTQSVSYTNSVLLGTGDSIEFLVGRGTNASAAGAEPILQASVNFTAPNYAIASIPSANPSPRFLDIHLNPPVTLQDLRQAPAFSWASTPGTTYVIQRKAIGDADWTVVGTVTATGNVTEFTDDTAAGSYIYRLAVLAP